MAASASVRDSRPAVQIGAPTAPDQGPRRGPLSVPGEQTCQTGSREARWALRRGLWRVSKLPRLWKCGRYLTDPAGTHVAVKNGSAYYTGLTTCGSIWSCPCCSARIRQRRALEIERACVQHLGAAGGIGFATFTLAHERTDDLADLLRVVQQAWEKVQQSGTYRRLGVELEVCGRIRATEVTFGHWHGWHPHLHVLIFAEQDLSAEEWARLRDVLSDAWCAAVVRLGRKSPGAEVGVTLSKVYRAEVGQYLAKVQDHYGQASTVGLEMARGDVKKGRKLSRTPFELAEDAVHGVMPELPLWWAYEAATKGRRAIEWSRGLKARFDLEDLDDEDLAAADVDGDRVAWVEAGQWALLVKRGKETHVLDLVEQGGQPAAHAFLAGLAGTEQEDRA